MLWHEVALAKTTISGCENLKTSTRRLARLFAGFAVRIDDSRLPKYLMPGHLADGAERGCGGQKAGWEVCLGENLELF